MKLNYQWPHFSEIFSNFYYCRNFSFLLLYVKVTPACGLAIPNCCFILNSLSTRVSVSLSRQLSNNFKKHFVFGKFVFRISKLSLLNFNLFKLTHLFTLSNLFRFIQPIYYLTQLFAILTFLEPCYSSKPLTLFGNRKMSRTESCGIILCPG